MVEYTIKQGIDRLSWRQAAADLGVSPTTLVHHFGTKEQMVQTVLARLRERTFTDVEQRVGHRADLASAARASWERAADPERWPETRLLFDVYAHALQEPHIYAEFLEHVIADWKADLVLAQDGVPVHIAEREATLVIATIRGLLLDLLATGDRERVAAAAEGFLAGLERASASGT
ncbi:TetR family transcriptional regulator [Agromyces sp. MMS24-JH15]|uniref:TetR family transcriptional regulator n=1 Tax=Agromyces sp. MMS24-JH15 TaxID=3243765 RepID=UPI0037495103